MTAPADPEPPWILVLRPAPGAWTAPPEVRMRALLKRLLRSFGFVCVEIRVTLPVDTPPAVSATTLEELTCAD
jgi:hypothetical protein